MTRKYIEYRPKPPMLRSRENWGAIWFYRFGLIIQNQWTFFNVFDDIKSTNNIVNVHFV